MDVVVVRGVVDGLKEPLELPGGPAVHDQNVGDPHGRRVCGVRRVVVPLHVHISLTWMQEINMLTQNNNHEWAMTAESCPLHSRKTPHCMLGAHLYSRLSSEPSGGAKSAPPPVHINPLTV